MSSLSRRNPLVSSSQPTPSQSGPPSQLGFDDLEEPPPYTPNASITSGETTIEVGPNRPFQTVQPSASPSRNGVSQVRSTSVVQQLSDTFIDIVNNLGSSVNSFSNSSNYNQGQRPNSNNWSSNPGQNHRLVPPNPTPRNIAPPRAPPQHPLSPSASLRSPPLSTSTHSLPSMTTHSSDFARDFYAVGTGNGEALVTESAFAPPTGSPSSSRQAPATKSVPNDGRPTSQPQPGHPLLRDGNLLVYPRGYECGRCHNVGYREGQPQKPCDRCWKKYAKSFSGPLVYSFPANTASSSLASNFQKPLPLMSTSASSAASSSAPQHARLTRRHPSSQGCGHNSPTGFMAPSVPPPIPPPPIPPPTSRVIPPPTSVTYCSGDPRIGGTLCWRCDGKGSIDIFFFDAETCPVCSGIGRVFQ